jgi:type I restriction enzyme M protein
VPEGIIFQSQTAYKQLRKMLVEGYLVAVVSLPAGVFNPYSGVKTSILILDKSLAKKTSTIAFFKVENDGFGLGAQRREIDKNDLPNAADFLKAYLQSITFTASDPSTPNALIVEKAKIATNGEYNLSGERYRDTIAAHTKWPLVPLSKICELRSGLWKGEKEPLHVVKILRNTNFTKTGFLNLEDVAEHPVELKQLESRLLKYGDIILEKSGGGPTQPVGRVALFNIPSGEYSYSNFTARIRVVDEKANCFFVWLILNQFYQSGKTEGLQKQTSGIRNLDNTAYQKLQVPLPPLEMQKEIVAEIEGYQKVIDGARAVLDNYRPHIPIHPDWPMVELGELIDELESGVSVNSTNRPTFEGEFGILKTSCVTNGVFDPNEHKSVLPEEYARLRCSVRGNTIIISRMNTEALVGANAFVPQDYPHLFLPDRLWQTVISRADVEVCYIQTLLASKDFRDKISALCGGTSGSMKNISKPQLLSLRIPLPPIETQRAIVAEIEAEQALVAANRELIARFEKKIQATLARVWGEDAPSAAKE